MDLPSVLPAARLFSGVTDPRVERTRRHLLCDILLIALCATLAGAEGFCDIEEWAEMKAGWLRTFLALPGGIPSHDTFERVFRRLDPKELHACFLRWMESLLGQAGPGRQMAIDGKSLRRSFDGAGGRRALHVVSAFAADGLGLVLGQVAVEDKSNEIEAIPQLLRLLDLRGVVVTIDAMGCHKEIAAQITAQGGDYLLALKANHPLLHEDAQRLFADEVALKKLRAKLSRAHSGVEKDHGRIEERACVALPAEALFGSLRGLCAWPAVASLCLVESRRQPASGGAESIERRYFLSSLPAQAKRLLTVARGHWAIENNLHWMLDVHFDEDRCRVRKDHAPLNLAVLRRVALSLAKRDAQTKCSVRLRLKRAGWDDAYLFRLLNF
jgi:predicted transposase YbfD/YdcC